jgi:hypothetical protein
MDRCTRTHAYRADCSKQALVRAFLDRGPTSPRLNEDALTKSQNDGSVPLMRTKCSSPSLESVVTCARCSHLGELVGGSVPVRARFDRRWSLPTGKLCHQVGEELCVGRIEEVELSPPPLPLPPQQRTQIRGVCTHRHFTARWVAF